MLAAILSNPQRVFQHAIEHRGTAPSSKAPERNLDAATPSTSAEIPRIQDQIPPKEENLETPTSPEEQRLIDDFRKLPFGTWVEFVADGDKPPRRLKLSWFSHITGTCMFVDAFGRKAETRPIRTVAADMLANRATIIRQSTQQFFERALQSIQEMLRIPQKSGPGPVRSTPPRNPHPSPGTGTQV